MTTSQARTLLAKLNALTVEFQLNLDPSESAFDERIDDEVVPLMMDASDIISRAIESLTER